MTVKNTSGNRIPKRQGFALIVTLTLMVLLSILALGLISLSTISLRTTSRGSAQNQARANARLALMLALGSLQSELGPDRRINCSADIDAAVPPGQRKWLATYDSWRAEDPNRPDSATKFRRYLLSGDKTTLGTLASAKTPLSGETVTLVGQGTLGSMGMDGKVTAGLVSVAASGSKLPGKYAWWIGDENAKAKINAGRDIPSKTGYTSECTGR